MPSFFTSRRALGAATIPPAPQPVVKVGPYLTIKLADWQSAAKANQDITIKVAFRDKAQQAREAAILARYWALSAQAWSVSPQNPAAIYMTGDDFGKPRNLKGLISTTKTLKMITPQFEGTSWMVNGNGTLDAYYRGVFGVGYPPAPPNGKFVSTYKGLQNTVKLGGITAALPIWTPPIDGKVVLWKVKPPFDDDNNTWGVFVTYEGNHVYTFRLARLDKDILQKFFEFLEAVVDLLCDLITTSKLQAVRDAAGAAPEPHVQAAVAAWSEAATACGLLMPTTPSATPAPDSGPPAVTPSFWDQYQTPILVGGAALLGIVILKTVLARRSA